MRYRFVVAAVAAVTVAGCADDASVVATTVIFDGETFTIDAPADCVRQLDGRLAILAPRQGAPASTRDRVRVVLADTNRLVVESVGIRVGASRGFSDVADEMWATKADDAYTVSGRLAPEAGSTTSHQFQIDVTCQHVRQEYMDIKPATG